MSSDDVLTQAAQRLRDLATQIDRQAAISVRPGQLEVLERIAAKVRDCADVVHGAGRPISAPDREALARLIDDELNAVHNANSAPDAEDDDLRSEGEIADRLISAGVVAQPPATLPSIALLAAERHHAIALGYGSGLDDLKTSGSLAEAAICYAANYGDVGVVDDRWPWGIQYWKPTGDRVRDLVKAGQFIAAEIDRLLRARDSSREAGQPAPPDAYVCKCPGSGTHAHVRGCDHHPEAGQP